MRWQTFQVKFQRGTPYTTLAQDVWYNTMNKMSYDPQNINERHDLALNVLEAFLQHVGFQGKRVQLGFDGPDGKLKTTVFALTKELGPSFQREIIHEYKPSRGGVLRGMHLRDWLLKHPKRLAYLSEEERAQLERLLDKE